MAGPEQLHSVFARLPVAVRQSLVCLTSDFLEPMKQGEWMRQCMRLRFREMREPTDVWTHEIDQRINAANFTLSPKRHPIRHRLRCHAQEAAA
jgi:hypothetical protein